MTRKNGKKHIINYENSIKKSNELSMAKLTHGLTLNQMQLLAFTIYCTQQNGKTEFHKAEFEKKFDLEKYHTVHAKQDIEALDMAIVNLINEVDLKKELIRKKSIKLFRYIEYNKGAFIFKWDEELTPHIIDLKEKYVTVDLTITSRFRSNFTWTLYDFLKAHHGYWHKIISKDTLMELFGVEDVKSYQKNAGLFKKKVLDVAVNEINKHTELEVWYKEEKEGRSIVGFDLHWSTGEKVTSATKKQIKEIQSIVDTVFEEMFQYVNINNEKDRQKAVEIVREIESMRKYTHIPISITNAKADEIIQKLAWNFQELNRLLEKNHQPLSPETQKAKVKFYNWLEERD